MIALDDAVAGFASLRGVTEALFCDWAALTSPRTVCFSLVTLFGTSVLSESEASFKISNMLPAAVCREDGEALKPMLSIELGQRGKIDRGSANGPSLLK